MGVVNMAWEPDGINFRARCFKPRQGLYHKGMTYDQQGAVYFACKHYFTLLNEDEKHRFKKLLWECSKFNQNHYNALFEYLTCELTVRDICEIYKIGKSNFYRYLDEFYLNFEYVKIVY